jgi:hypothetical protein
MALFEITTHRIQEISQATFTELKLKERGDLQRLLRSQIEVLGDELYVIAEEFGDWSESRRRIDLLALDKEANLVVIELKRTNDGGHMELQAIRYASMVSTMTLERAIEIHAGYLEHIGQKPEDAERLMLEFLGWEEPDEEHFAEDVRILLVSEDFGKELTTAVLWLRERDIDIRCVRLRPYKHGESTFMDVQQIIPLPEVNAYQVQVRQKEQQERKIRSEKHARQLRFWQQLVALARAKNARHANRKPSEYYYLKAAAGVNGLSFTYTIIKDNASVELYIDAGSKEANEALFDRLMVHTAAIEESFGHPLHWEKLENKRASRISYDLNKGGLGLPESEWPVLQQAMVETMMRLEAALTPAMNGLRP